MVRFLLLFVLLLSFTFSWSQVSDSLLQASKSRDPEVARPALAQKYSIMVRMGELDEVMREVNNNLETHYHKNNSCFKALFYNVLGTCFYYKGAYNECLPHFQKAITLWEVCGDQEEMARAMSNAASIYGSLGKLDTAEIILLENFEIRKQLKDTSGLISTGNNLAEVYRLKGNIDKALEQAFSTLKYTGENTLGEASIFDIIASLYEGIDNLDEAFKYWKKAYKIRLEKGDQHGIASSELNHGIYYSYKEEFDSAKHYLNLAITNADKLNNNSIKAYAKNDLATIHKIQGNYEEARKLYLEVVATFQKYGDYGNLSSIYGNLCEVESAQQNYNRALEYCQKSLEIREQINSLDRIRDAHYRLSIVYENLGNLKKALHHHQQYVIFKDSVLNKEKLKQINDLKIKYETEKQILENEKLKAKNEKAEAESKLKDKKIEAQSARLYLYVTIIAVVIVLALLILLALNRQRKLTREIRDQKNKVEEQKHIVDEQKNEIVESIQYAKRLQSAILPHYGEWNMMFLENFVFFQPKDIVSGDFYWHNEIGDRIFFAVADCTGHGVPGAMVSFVCYNALNAAIKQGIMEPDKILDFAREQVLETFSATKENINDGMDIALCQFNKKTKTLSFSGAYNSLWVVSDQKHLERQNAHAVFPSENYPDYTLFEWKGDKMPVGKSSKEDAFTKVEIQIHSNDTIYLTSDGFADQFGGDKGKKLKSKNMKELIVSLQHIPLRDQGKTLDSYFEKWKKDFEQLDDVCVIGVKL